MQIPASTHFSPVDLSVLYNASQRDLPDTLRLTRDEMGSTVGQQSYQGIPFRLGEADAANVLLLDQDPLTVDLAGCQATYLIFLHCVEDRITNYQDGLADFAIDGNEMGNHVSEYLLTYADGTSVGVPILRRFAIQQTHIGWGASPFEAVPAKKSGVFPTTNEAQALGEQVDYPYGRGETRHTSGRDSTAEKLWLYALVNPHPEKPIQQLICTPKEERSVIYGLSTTQVAEHPLRPGTRQKLRLTLPAGTNLNEIHELSNLSIDLGQVISARAALEYDRNRWQGDEPIVQPQQSEQAVIVEYVAHPQAKLYVETTGEPAVYALDGAQAPEQGLLYMAAAQRPVTIRVVEKGSNRPVAVRLHLHGPAGEYLPPRGYHRKVNGYWFEDNYGEFVNDHNQYVYIWGECVADLPLGEVSVEITKGYEVAPIRTVVQVNAETKELVFEIDRLLRWRDQGWVTADTHVHFLSPQTALLEGAAEGVNVVNLLASQWGEMFSNVSDFDGRTTLGANDFATDESTDEDEFLVRVGTENRMQVLGHISLLGYSGSMITPLCTGGPSESAIGDPQEVSMAEWAQRCIAQGGLTVMPHGPNPQCERAADLVLGLINAVEMMTFNPLSPRNGQINPYGLADWYRYLNLGLQVPIVGGSDKMAAASLLGGIRTYAHLGNLHFNYENWMEAVRGGNTFVTVGPLVALQVEGMVPGRQVNLPTGGGSVQVTWQVASVSLPVYEIEIIVGGLTHETISVNGLSAQGNLTVPVTESTWIALRVRGSYQGKTDEIAAHTSAVQVLIDEQPIFRTADAMTVLTQIEGAMAYVDTLAPRPEANRFRQMRASLEAAHNRLHQQMHRNGVFHGHTPLHEHGGVS